MEKPNLISRRRKGSEEERWNGTYFDAVKGVSWEPTPGIKDDRIKCSVRFSEEEKNSPILLSVKGWLRFANSHFDENLSL